MKNLILLTEKRHAITLPQGRSQGQEGCIQAIIANPNAEHDDPFYDPSDPTPFNYALSPFGILSALSAIDSIIWTVNLNEIVDADVEQISSSWFHLSWNEASEELVALSHEGAILSLDPNGSGGKLIGCFDFGINCARWSIDGEILALVTLEETEDDAHQSEEKSESGMPQALIPVLMTMNSTFEILSEVQLPPNAPSSSILICWNQSTTSSGLVSISTHDLEDNTRRVRIYTGEDLELKHISRSEDGSGKSIPNLLEGGLAWAGDNCSHNLACVQRKGRRGRNIVFLEPNGLQHGGFKLERIQAGEEVVRLDWNSESDLIAVTIIGNADGGQFGKVQLYHRCNYHWYLKWDIVYPNHVTVSTVKFDDLQGYNLIISLKTKGELRQEWRDYTFIWDSSTSCSRGTAFVVDGEHLNITTLHKALVPPPFYGERLTFDASIISVSHVPTCLRPFAEICGVDAIVQLSNHHLVFVGKSFTKERSNVMPWKALASLDLSNEFEKISDIDASCLRQMLVVDISLDESVVFMKCIAATCFTAPLESNSPASVDKLLQFTVRFSFVENLLKEPTIVDSDIIHLEGRILRMANWSDEYTCASLGEEKTTAIGGALLELIDGRLFEFTSAFSGEESQGEVLPCTEGQLLEPCPSLAGICKGTEGQPLVVGLSFRSRLFCGERQLCDAASSFMITPTHGFLSYVTLGSRSQVRFLPLGTLMSFDPFMGADENLDILGEGYEPRSVERGSRLVTVMADRPTLVLQLPRGNLEAVYPRALVLPYIMKLIEAGNYSTSLDIMRRQKVDMNLIVDMDPIRCIEGGGIEKLVEQVSNMDHLNLFIASLSNFDVTTWKYCIPKWFKNGTRSEEDGSGTKSDNFEFGNKVNLVCLKMRSSMMEREAQGLSPDGQFLLPVLSTFAKESPPKLENALTLIKSNAMSQSSTSRSGKQSFLLSEKAQSSIKYLAFLADYELLFDNALGMYDYDLAKAVARNSQMDPKVYLPMLKRLRSLPEFVARFEVDIKLERYESALDHLYKSGIGTDQMISQDHFDKCLSFVEKYNLHRLGLDLFKSYQTWHQKVMISLGNSLLNTNKPETALSIFLSARPRYLDGAKRAARACGDWRTFFSVISEDLDMKEEEKQNLAAQIADEISSGKGGLERKEKYASAARILVDYCEDTYGAIDMLIAGEMWFEARRLASMIDDCELQFQINDAAKSYAQTCISDFYSKKDSFLEADKRYREVILIRKQARRDGEQVVDDQHDETGSLFSMASNASNLSVSSNMSSSSVGSVSSVSSVISASSVTSFSLVGVEAENRHKSKYNKLGRGGKKKKKKKKATRRERMGLKPGSEEELASLVNKLKDNVISVKSALLIAETIRFLSQVEMTLHGKDLYEAYENFKTCIKQVQEDRVASATLKEAEEEREYRQEGKYYERVILDCEKDVDRLTCADLPREIHDLFSYCVV